MRFYGMYTGSRAKACKLIAELEDQGIYLNPIICGRIAFSDNFWILGSLFPTLAAVGLLDFKVNVVLARLEADFSDQPPSIPAVPNQ